MNFWPLLALVAVVFLLIGLHLGIRGARLLPPLNKE